jgi:hypothetical protein
MNLLITYVVCLIVGQSVTLWVGVLIDRMYSPAASLPVSIGLYFVMFWLCWKVAVKVTEPKPANPEPPRA